MVLQQEWLNALRTLEQLCGSVINCRAIQAKLLNLKNKTRSFIKTGDPVMVEKKIQIRLTVNRQWLGLPWAEYFNSNSSSRSKNRLLLPSSCSNQGQEARSHSDAGTATELLEGQGLTSDPGLLRRPAGGLLSSPKAVFQEWCPENREAILPLNWVIKTAYRKIVIKKTHA